MVAWRWVFGVVLAASAAACGGAAAEPAAPPERDAARAPAAAQETAPDRWLTAEETPRAAPPSRTLLGSGPILIGEPAPPPEPTRPPRKGRVRVSFHHAALDNALQLLADTGKFNLVVESGLTGSVSATLDGVDAYDALVAIAEANGAEVHYQRGIVTVRRRAK